jgi:hypothetical protein
MPEPIAPIETPPVDAATQLATLTQAHQEVLAKRTKDKAKIAELETGSASLQARLTAAEAQVHEAIVGQPLKALAESISPVPTVWLNTFGQHFNVESKDGVVVIHTKDGKPLKDANGQTVKFDRGELAKYLTESEPESERTRLFRIITAVSKASGGSGTTANGPGKSKTKPTLHNFGLR